MGKSVELSDEARRDFDESFDWYAKRSDQAAIGFAIEFDLITERIAGDTDRFPRKFAGCQYCAMRRYPYRIIFCDDGLRIVVIAVAHAKRRPRYWQNRT
jgi:plasmid stabilization system protein ParE